MVQSDSILEMKHISKRFPGVLALDDVHLCVNKGSVHALMGENGAGKSTLMKCLFAIYQADKGEIILDGEKVEITSPKQALKLGISMVHQELNQVPKMSVADNIWLGRFKTNKIFINDQEMLSSTQRIFDDLSIKINPKSLIEDLSVSDRQMVEIAKAISHNSKVIVMDEPTSSLTEREVDNLFFIIKQLKERGCGVIYISHKMEEILRIADCVTVMRDGRWVATHSASELTTESIIKLMVGRELSMRFPQKHNAFGDILLSVKNLKSYKSSIISNISFELHRGEILGVAGLEGSKRTEVLETIFGLRKFSEGEIILNGNRCNIKNSKHAIESGIALLTEERKKNGMFPNLSVEENMISASLSSYCSWGFVNKNKIKKDTEKVINQLRIKTNSRKTKLSHLSGGNQQKVIIGKWLLTNPDVLLLDEPTRGIDVGAKYEIYQMIVDLTAKGKGIIMVSSEMPELLGVTDRIMVMSNGRVAGIVETAKASQKEIMKLSTKYL